MHGNNMQQRHQELLRKDKQALGSSSNVGYFVGDPNCFTPTMLCSSSLQFNLTRCCTYIHTHICVCVCMYVCMYICMYVCKTPS